MGNFPMVVVVNPGYPIWDTDRTMFLVPLEDYDMTDNLWNFGSTINSVRTFNYWILKTVVPAMEATFGISIGTSFQINDKNCYPMVMTRFYQEQVWSARRGQYTDRCKLHVVVNKNDEYTGRLLCNGVMDQMGISQQAMYQIKTLDMQGVNDMTPADFANPNFTVPLRPVTIEIRTEGGWEVKDLDERVRHFVRDFSLYY